MNRVAIIANPAAGNKKLLGKLEMIQKKLEQKSPDVGVYLVSKPGDGTEIVRSIANHVDMIVSVGGDGTVHELINALCPLPQRPIFAILPGGTCNDFSRTLGISQEPEEAIEQLMEGKIAPVDVGKHNDRYFLNFWGVGLITQVSEQIDPDIKRDWGRLAYYLSAVQSFSQPPSFFLEVTSESHYFRGYATMMIVGNGSYVGGMETYFPRNNVQDGLLDVLIIRKASLEALRSILYSHLIDERPNSEDLFYFQAKSLQINTHPVQKVDCDGEKKTFTPATLTILPKHLQMVVGHDFIQRTRHFFSIEHFDL
ncbi:diacylglycerol/lipid kinase family protein [Thermoflavimicrobium dichotomicum]|uniref:Lipid kinase, YegS/Rv2252/BmrU family n=1 Tax=Thermoflavimicrobium dichotomicum TaxID=46223 RepID=A0A1I3MLN7_9BACL|nr:diacylglycerol kinase family protein [Thermoflavimicrobium dichotomicum]SFI97852.1 lipid kinase, YegS/Rv2252/BmrU family [Thermoflavimicrobium dichotomicum]